METKQVLMAPLPSARSRYKAGPDLQHSFIHPKGTVVNLQKKRMETHFPCAVCKLWYCPMWVSWSTRNHCLRTGVAPSATEAGFALPCVTQGTGWVLPRKVAEATVLVPLGHPWVPFVSERHHWPVGVGLYRHQGTQRSLPGEQQPAL